jgi:hypothetical protein
MRRWLIFDVLFLAILAGYVWGGYPLAPFHGDESINIALSQDYAYRYVQRDVDALRYQTEPPNPVEQGYRISDPPLTRYVIGAAWHAGGFTSDAINLPWWFAQDFDWNMQNGFYPGDDLLLTSRRPITTLSILALWGVVLLARLVGGRLAGTVAGLYLVTQPTFLLNGRRAMQEGVHLSTHVALLLTALALTWAWSGGRRRVAWSVAVLLGVVVGLAVAGRHTNTIVVAAVAVGLVGAGVSGRQAHTTRLPEKVGQALMAGVVAAGVFWYWNPVLWDAPLTVSNLILEQRAAITRDQATLFDASYSGRATTRLAGLWRQVFANANPMYYEVDAWADAIGGQIATYAASGWGGLRVAYLGAVTLPLALLGWWRVWQTAGGVRWVLGVWGVFALVWVLLLVPAEWGRYYLPFLPIYAVWVGVGACVAVDVGGRFRPSAD